MKRKRPGSLLLAVVACFSALSQPLAVSAGVAGPSGQGLAPKAAADLLISEFVFLKENEKAVRVHVLNRGGTASRLCILRLTVRKINGVPAGRVTEVKLPSLSSGKAIWLLIHANSILPNNVSLKATTFKLNADATSIITESDEANNEVWHNL